jgi:hypothetical protein
MLMEVAQEPPLDRDRIVRGNFFIALLFHLLPRFYGMGQHL